MAEGSTMEEPRASRALSTDGRLVTCCFGQKGHLPSASAQEGGCVLLEIHHGLHSRLMSLHWMTIAIWKSEAVRRLQRALLKI
jgi:hypothetical protein